MGLAVVCDSPKKASGKISVHQPSVSSQQGWELGWGWGRSGGVLLESPLGHCQELVVGGGKFSPVGLVPVCLLTAGDLSTFFPSVSRLSTSKPFSLGWQLLYF